MNRFQAHTHSDATLAADTAAVWAVLTDPDLLVRMTPNLTRIDTDGDRWTWHLTRIPVLSTAIQPSFTERMEFEEGRRIGFTHDGDEERERTGAEGEYLLTAEGDRTRVAIDITIWVDLPLPRVSRPAVQSTMHAFLAATGRVFSRNMRRHLRG
ncbi:SRPBCC family protein [Nocardioides coralli]|uniref:SRPBCC family protein n=1 Tax=Nocardioides coralli TaxID=2872154 RepID=UPI001CA3DCA2|nr:SRPBCC family protein [Nocardioides coralli]QZY30650.1 SRPBCC family protein [Nocardioides coralli]